MTTDNRSIPAVLTIAGSDSSGGAGIQADLKTMAAHGVYGMSVITAVTAQNTCGVRGIENISGNMIKSQLEAVFEDIPPAAVKIGMLSAKETVQIVADALEKYQPAHIVLDPVMVATSGDSLTENDTIPYILERLFPLAELATPNLPEAGAILQIKKGPVSPDIQLFSEEESFLAKAEADPSVMEKAAKYIYDTYGCNVFLKGGHLKNSADDILYTGTADWYRGEKIHCTNTHGTGCTLSSAIACHLALGLDLKNAVAKAKEYVRQAMSAGLNLGAGNGPLHHGYLLNRTEKIHRFYH